MTWLELSRSVSKEEPDRGVLQTNTLRRSVIFIILSCAIDAIRRRICMLGCGLSRDTGSRNPRMPSSRPATTLPSKPDSSPALTHPAGDPGRLRRRLAGCRLRIAERRAHPVDEDAPAAVER